MLCPEIEVESDKVQFAAEFASRGLIDRRVQQLAKAEEFLTQLHLDGKTVGVLQHFESKPQVFGDTAVVVKIQRLAFSRKIVERTLGLGSSDSLFDDSIEKCHASILSNRPAEYAVFMVRECGSCGKTNRIPAGHLADQVMKSGKMVHQQPGLVDHRAG